MSSVGTTSSPRSSPLSVVAFAVVVIALVNWVLAATVSDALFLPAALVGAGSVAVAAKARKDGRRDGSNDRVALAAGIVGGAVALQVVAYLVVYGISQLV